MVQKRNKADRRAPAIPVGQASRLSKTGGTPVPPSGTRWDGGEFEARRAQRLKTAEILNRERTPLEVIYVAETAATLADQTIQETIRRFPPRPPIACQEGCAWCCYKLVGTTISEVLRIAAYLRENLSADEFQATQERIIQTDEQRQSLKHDRWKAARLACPLLVDNRCSVYSVRPLTCRGYNSSDPRACEQMVKERERVEVPVYTPQHRLATFILDGMRAGLAESGLKNEVLELTAALRIVLTTPKAVERWLAGQAVFGLARLPA
jgi:Fe-S-cluster containining protein